MTTPAPAALVLAHLDLPLRYTRAHVRRFPRSARFYDDLLQEARLGLVEAAARYDATKGAAFPTFAHYYVARWIQVAALHFANVLTHHNGGQSTQAARALVDARTVPIEPHHLTNPGPDTDALDTPGLIERARAGLTRVRTARDRKSKFVSRDVDVFMRLSFGGETGSELAAEYGLCQSGPKMIRQRLRPMFEQWAAHIRNEAA